MRASTSAAAVEAVVDAATTADAYTWLDGRSIHVSASLQRQHQKHLAEASKLLWETSKTLEYALELSLRSPLICLRENILAMKRARDSFAFAEYLMRGLRTRNFIPRIHALNKALLTASHFVSVFVSVAYTSSLVEEQAVERPTKDLLLLHRIRKCIEALLQGRRLAEHHLTFYEHILFSKHVGLYMDEQELSVHVYKRQLSRNGRRKDYFCAVCKKHYCKAEHLAVHFFEKHMNFRNCLSCPYCTKCTFTSQSALRIHLFSHAIKINSTFPRAGTKRARNF